MRDLMGMMGQVKQLQEKMQQLQAELETTEVTGTSGGGLVVVTLTAKGEMKKIEIDASLMKPDEKEIVEDLVTAAHADARGKAERLVQEKASAAVAESDADLPIQADPEPGDDPIPLPVAHMSSRPRSVRARSMVSGVMRRMSRSRAYSR
jgi:DNA-binding YbaB/EbfC family protein